MKTKKQLIDELNQIIDKKIIKGEDYTTQAKLHRQLTARPRKTQTTRPIIGTNFLIKTI